MTGWITPLDTDAEQWKQAAAAGTHFARVLSGLGFTEFAQTVGLDSGARMHITVRMEFPDSRPVKDVQELR